MKKFYVVSVNKRNRIRLIYACIIAFLIISVNRYYFTGFYTPLKTTAGFFGYSDMDTAPSLHRNYKLTIVIKGLEQDEKLLSEVINTIEDKELYILDNRSDQHTDVNELLVSGSITYLKNDVLIDASFPKNKIKKQLQKAASKAVESGSAIAVVSIGTEGSEIIAQAIEEILPEFHKRNISLVFVFELLD